MALSTGYFAETANHYCCNVMPYLYKEGDQAEILEQNMLNTWFHTSLFSEEISPVTNVLPVLAYLKNCFIIG